MGTLHDATTLTEQRIGFRESDAEGAPSTPTAETSRDNLASLYRPPYHLMFNGPFDRAKDAACDRDKWLLLNLQSTKEFTSHTLNRDTWGNEAVAETISNYFTFWQVYDDTTDCIKLCTFYKLETTPVVLVIDPITGQKMRSWRGMVEPEDLLEDLVPFMDSSPKNYRPTLSKGQRESSSMENMEKSSALIPEKEEITRTPQKPTYLPLPEEPAADGNLLCRVGIRLPDGRRLRRNSCVRIQYSCCGLSALLILRKLRQGNFA
ncbi:UBX domain-containing protein [Melia azedarach]|uniref:UBX domain-containing protein n=1 Tax=Melia azedarach TaxID=155640 RepID=A0ACC1Z3E4_MELAZ|nr:UBX domain-containing protein [Melia azedarach]